MTKQQLYVGKHLQSGTYDPILWVHIVQENQSDMIHALRMVINELQNMKLLQVPGKNVHMCMQQINEPCCWLEAANWLPDDIGTKICNVLTTASVEAFHILIHNMHWELDKNPMAYSYSEIIQEEDVLYNRCIALKQWLQMSTEAKDKLFAMYADL